MPVEIRELVIRAVVAEQDSSEVNRVGQINPEEKEEIIAECIDQVLQILHEQSER